MGRKYRGLILLAPLSLIYLLLIGGGIFKIFIESLGYIPHLSMNQVSVEAYKEVLLKKGFFVDLLYSIYLALTASIISMFLGVYLSFRLTQTKNIVLKKLVTKIMEIGIVLPYLYMLFIVVVLYSKTGIYSRLLYALGVIDHLESFPSLLYEPLGIGIIVVFVLKGVPFVTIFVLNIMNNVSESFENVAKTLGASPLKTLIKVYIPLCKDAIVWSFMVLLAYDLGSFEVPYLLGSLSPNSLSVRLFSSYLNPNILKIPEAMAMALILFVLGIAIVGLSALVLGKLIGGSK